MLYYSAWYPIIGSFLLGFRFLLRSIMVAEIARSYSEDEVSRKLPLFSNFYYVGLCPTVVILLFFEKVDIHIGGFHIQYGNINAIFIIVMTIIIQVLAVFYAHDLSMEYDLKQEEATQSKKSEYEEIKMVKNEERKGLLVENRFGHLKNMKRLFTSFDVVLSYFLTFLFGYAELTMLKYIPIVVLTKLNYSIIVLNIGLLANSLLSIAIIVFLVRVYVTSKSAYYACLIAFLSMIVVGFLFLLMNPTNSYTVNWILAMLVYSMFSVFYLADDVFLVCITAKLVKSDIQSFAESFTLSFKHIASILAGLSIEIVADY